MSSFKLEAKGLDQLAQAMTTIPTREFLKRITATAGLTAKGRLAFRPPEMAATPGTKGESSNGNVPASGKAFWRRGDGGYYVPKGSGKGKKKLLLAAIKRADSENLYESWEITKSNAGMIVDVQSNASYAGYVQGGKRDKPVQSDVMKRRGWDTTDEAAKFVESEIGAIIEKTIKGFFQEWLARYGITAR